MALGKSLSLLEATVDLADPTKFRFMVLNCTGMPPSSMLLASYQHSSLGKLARTCR